MQFRPLGKTGLNLSVVSFGAASMGNEYGNAADEARSIRALHVALDGGVNFLLIRGRTAIFISQGRGHGGKR